MRHWRNYRRSTYVEAAVAPLANVDMNVEVVVYVVGVAAVVACKESRTFETEDFQKQPIVRCRRLEVLLLFCPCQVLLLH